MASKGNGVSMGWGSLAVVLRYLWADLRNRPLQRGASVTLPSATGSMFHWADSRLHAFFRHVAAQGETKSFTETVRAIIKPFLVRSLAILVFAALAWWQGLSIHPATWAGGITLDAIVAGGLLAFSAWLGERLPRLLFEWTKEAVEYGVAEWNDDFRGPDGVDKLESSLEGRSVVAAAQTAQNGLLLLLASLVSYPVGGWLPARWQDSILVALTAATVITLWGLSQALTLLSGVRWFWPIYHSLKADHSNLPVCVVCGEPGRAAENDTRNKPYSGAPGDGVAKTRPLS